MRLLGNGDEKDVIRCSEKKGACHLGRQGGWINLIRDGEEQSARVREAPVKSSKVINTVAIHLGCVCNQTVEMH